jgi:hypothetical protein
MLVRTRHHRAKIIYKVDDVQDVLNLKSLGGNTVPVRVGLRDAVAVHHF